MYLSGILCTSSVLLCTILVVSYVPFWYIVYLIGIAVYHLGSFLCTSLVHCVPHRYYCVPLWYSLCISLIFFVYLSGIFCVPFWYFLCTFLVFLCTKSGINKPSGLLQDTHFVHTKYYLVRGDP